MKIMKYASVAAGLLIFQTAIAGEVFIINNTNDSNSMTDKLVVHYKVCGLVVGNFNSPICTPTLQVTRQINSPESYLLPESIDEIHQVVVYSVDVINGGYTIYSQNFPPTDYGTTNCVNQGGAINLSALNGQQSVTCNSN